MLFKLNTHEGFPLKEARLLYMGVHVVVLPKGRKHCHVWLCNGKYYSSLVNGRYGDPYTERMRGLSYYEVAPAKLSEVG